VALGLFKKMAVADNLALWVDGVYGPQGAWDPPSLLLGTYAYAFQIYADFSGYSDIAIGVARMMGFRLVTNFDTPYFAASVTEFWRRWHMSLSSWLRDYLYIPLGGNRMGRGRTYLNLMITMLLGGLWHGASWTFVVWGGLNGLYLAASKAWSDIMSRRHPAGPTVPAWIAKGVGILLTFHLICLSWIYFRAPDLGRAHAIVTTLGSSLLSGGLLDSAARLSFAHILFQWRMPAALTAVLIGVDIWVGSGESRERWRLLPLPLRYVGYSTIVLATLAFGVFRATHFIYFQF
jgi:alginate O-acetyltransferase complex protein AlgI